MTVKAPYIPIGAVQKSADDFRKKYANNEIPVNTIEIAELQLGIESRPFRNLKSQIGVDAFITSGFDTIVVDLDSYMDDDGYRCIFSYAHEIGHYVLHRSFFETYELNDIEDYSTFLSAIPEQQYSIIEWQANEFAGRLLVPPNHLQKWTQKYFSDVPEDILEQCDNSLLASYLAVPIAPKFGVSQAVIERRILKEGLL